ncbi:MAG: hypothetical protein R3A13_09100 [Bdellovibrionota bacterium]
MPIPSGFAFGPVVGIASSVVGLISSLFSTPGPSLAQIMNDRFDRLETMLSDVYKSLAYRLDSIDQKLGRLVEYAQNNQELQFENRRALAAIGLACERNHVLLNKILDRSEVVEIEAFINEVVSRLGDFNTSYREGLSYETSATKLLLPG